MLATSIIIYKPTDLLTINFSVVGCSLYSKQLCEHIFELTFPFSKVYQCSFLTVSFLIGGGGGGGSFTLLRDDDKLVLAAKNPQHQKHIYINGTAYIKTCHNDTHTHTHTHILLL